MVMFCENVIMDPKVRRFNWTNPPILIKSGQFTLDLMRLFNCLISLFFSHILCYCDAMICYAMLQMRYVSKIRFFPPAFTYSVCVYTPGISSRCIHRQILPFEEFMMRRFGFGLYNTEEL